jgi:hypothetical protein
MVPPMSLEISIKVPGANGAKLKEMAARLPKAGKLGIKAARSIPLIGPVSGFDVTGVELSDQATERADHHLLTEDSRKNLRELLETFGRDCSRQFIFYAAWSGALPKRETEIELADFLQLVGNNHIGNRVTYRVKQLTHIVKVEQKDPVADGEEAKK